VLDDSRAETLVAAARGGDARSLARLVSLVENGSAELRSVMRAVAPYAGSARVVGLTGSPGAMDGTGTAARFNQPSGITADGGKLYVADFQNQTIRAVDIDADHRCSSFVE